MPHPQHVNPQTGRKYGWEAEQARKKAESPAAMQQELALLERLKIAADARENLLPFIEFTSPDPVDPNDVSKSAYRAQPFHRKVAEVLTLFEKGELRHADGRVCKQIIFAMPPRHGKSIAHDQPILTPDGWRAHGDLQPGDHVFGPDGKPVRVLDVSADVAEVVPVHLSNGEVIYAHLNHEWVVFDRARSEWRVMETREIKRRTLRVGPEGRGGRFVMQLPDATALDFPVRDLPLHPYVLGAWLGDGSAGSTRIAHAVADAEVIAAIEALGYCKSNSFVQKGTSVGYADFDGPRPNVASPMRAALRDLGVLNAKHVPEMYLRASIDQRLELLAGLVDTDGHVEKATGRVRFSTCSEALRDGVFDLAAGLGFRPYVVEVQPDVSSSGIVGRKTVYQVGFQPNRAIPTRIPRKRMTKFALRRRIAITAVGDVTFKRARSICVDRHDGLYVVGRHCVVTKNTQMATKHFSAWLSGKHPEWNVAVGTYSDGMAEDIGGDTRAILGTSQFKQVFPEHRLRKGSTAKTNFQTEKGGRLVFVGRGGPLTGKGAHVLLIDDLYKDHEEARSQNIRDQAWNWFTKVAMTRRMGRKLVMLTMTRWHSDDIIGRLTDPENPCYNAIEAKDWMIIRIPAIAEEDDVLGRAEGEPLWPEEFDLDFLMSQQRLDPLGFAALYQQRPTVADGVLFRRENIHRYDPADLPENLRYYCSSDHAVGVKQRNDPSCFGKAGVDKQDNLWFVDLFWKRVPTDQAVEAMLAMGSGSTAPLIWWAERGHISQSIGPFLYKRMAEAGTYINVREVTPVGDKEQRAQSIAARVAVGKVYIPKGPIWDKAVEEMLAFPNGIHDDFVDMLSLFGLGLQSQFGAKPPAAKKEPPKFGTLGWVKMYDAMAADQAAVRRTGGF